MKKILIAAGIISSVFNASAQKVTINWGEQSKKELAFGSFVKGKGNEMVKLCFDVEKHGFLGIKTTLTPNLARYNDKLSQLGEKQYAAYEEGVTFEDMLSIKGKLFLFTSRYDRESKTTSYFCQPINIETLNPEGKSINLGSFEAINRYSQSSVGYELSKDSSKILMFGNNAYKRNENEKYFIAVYDNNMTKLWDKTVELPYKDKFVTVQESMVTNDGKVGVVLKHYESEVSREDVRKDGARVPSYKTKMLIYEKESSLPKEYVLDLNNKFIHTVQLANDDQDNILLFGLYKEKASGYISGFFTVNFNKKTGAIATNNINKFPDALVEQIKIDKMGSDREKDPGLSSSFRLASVQTRDNGSQDFLLEYYVSYYVPPTKDHAGYWHYDYGDVININLLKDGKVVIARIPKLQMSDNFTTFSSFVAVPYKESLLVFYNDDDDNIEREITKRPDPLHKFNKSVFVMATIDKNGNVSRDILFRNRDNKLTTATKNCVVFDKNKIGLYAQNVYTFLGPGKDKIGILEIK